MYGSDDHGTLHPGLHLRAGDGTVHDGLLTDVLEAPEVEAAVARAAGDPDSPWWVIVEPSTGMGLPVSREHHLVTVETDHDGATVRIDVEPRRHAVDRLRDRDRIDRQWGAWLDPGTALGTEQIARGIAHAEQLVDSLLAAEPTAQDQPGGEA